MSHLHLDKDRKRVLVLYSDWVTHSASVFQDFPSRNNAAFEFEESSELRKINELLEDERNHLERFKDNREDPNVVFLHDGVAFVATGRT